METMMKKKYEKLRNVEFKVDCRLPWQLYEGMCLMWFGKTYDDLKLWTDARENCKKNVGELVWLNDEKEYKMVRRFARQNGYYGQPHVEFWIGLFRPRPGEALRWSSGSTSVFRGSNIKWKYYLYFATHSKEDAGTLLGYSSFQRLPYICRKGYL